MILYLLTFNKVVATQHGVKSGIALLKDVTSIRFWKATSTIVSRRQYNCGRLANWRQLWDAYVGVTELEKKAAAFQVNVLLAVWALRASEY